MRVTAWKNIDVEVEVDVKLDDCLNELIDTANSDDGPRMKASAIDCASRVLEKITPEMVASVFERNPDAFGILRERLKLWNERLAQ